MYQPIFYKTAKWNMISHDPEIDVNGEAGNSSSINIDMETEIFEVMKAGLVDYTSRRKLSFLWLAELSQRMEKKHRCILCD